MSQDEPFRRNFDLLADRLIEELTTQLKGIGSELSTAVDAERARAAADATLAAREDIESQAAERIAAAETRAQDAEAAARTSVAAAEERARVMVAATETRAKDDVAAAEARAHEAVNRAEALVQEAMNSAEARTKESVTAVETQARLAVSQAETRAHEAVEAVESRARVDVDTAVARVRAEMTAESTAATERLASAIRSLDTGQSLSDIMNTLVRCACTEAPRVGIFVREGAALRSWKLIGFEQGSDTPIDIAIHEAGIVAEALETAQVAQAGPAFQTSAPQFAQLPPDGAALAVPLVISREVIGVLYADAGRGDQTAHAAWTSTIEVLGRHATRALEVLTASKLLAQAMASRPQSMRPGGVAAR